ncbi:hypothetical protein J7K24_02530 [bacterium]|nr:hypothetical protein [bacterium]
MKIIIKYLKKIAKKAGDGIQTVAAIIFIVFLTLFDPNLIPLTAKEILGAITTGIVTTASLASIGLPFDISIPTGFLMAAMSFLISYFLLRNNDVF